MAEQRSERRNGVERPSILMELTETQIAELESQVEENDRQGFDWRAESFGWTREQADEVWTWMKSGEVRVEAVVEQ